MSREEWRAKAVASMRDYELWLSAAERDIELVCQSLLVVSMLRHVLERGVGQEEFDRIAMRIVVLEENAAGLMRQIPSNLHTAQAMMTQARIYEEEADNREWAEQRKENHGAIE